MPAAPAPHFSSSSNFSREDRYFEPAEDVRDTLEEAGWTEERLQTANAEVATLSNLVQGELRGQMRALQVETQADGNGVLSADQVVTIVRKFAFHMIRLVLHAKKFVQEMDLPAKVKGDLLGDLEMILGVIREESSTETLGALKAASRRETVATIDGKQWMKDVPAKDLMTVLMNRAKQVMSNKLADALTEMQVLQRKAVRLREQSERRNTVQRQVLRIPLSDMIELAGGELTTRKEEGKTVICFRDGKNEESKFVLPPNGVLYKGGLPRLLLKLVLSKMNAGEALAKVKEWSSFRDAPVQSSVLRGDERIAESMILKDRNQNDIDVIRLLEGSGEAPISLHLVEEAKALGADPDGVEFIGKKDMDEDDLMKKIFEGRDANINECVLSDNGLVVSDRAIEGMYTGIFDVNQANKEFYGIETFFYDGTMLATSRGEMRMLKFAAEGKFRGFNWCKLNRFIDPGVYWLVLFEKFRKKGNKAELFNNLIHLGKKAGLIGESETLKDVLTRTHEECPYFNVKNRGEMSDRKLLLWFAEKVARLASRKTKRRLASSTYNPVRVPGDTDQVQISIDDAPPLTEEIKRDIEKQIDEFVAEAELRTERFEAENGGQGQDFAAAIEQRRVNTRKKKQFERLDAQLAPERAKCLRLKDAYDQECARGQGVRAMDARIELSHAIAVFAQRTGSLPFPGAERYLPHGDDDDHDYPVPPIDRDDGGNNDDDDDDDDGDDEEHGHAGYMVIDHGGEDLGDK